MSARQTADRPTLVLGRGKEKSLLRRHPWLFSGAVSRIVGGSPEEGDVVDIVDNNGQWLAAAHFQQGSIVAKVISFSTNDITIESNPELWHKRVNAAIGLRKRLGLLSLHDTNAFRLIHSEGDYMPGLVVDYYNGVVVMQAHSVGMYRMLPQLADIIAEQLSAYCAVEAVYSKSMATLANVQSSDGFVKGEASTVREVTEYGNRMTVDLVEGQKTGFFIDQRENRHKVQNLASGRRVLNCFGYTGGFSLAALRGGASYVETVDISKKAINLCNDNVAQNFPSANHKGTVADVLHYFEGAQPTFDLIILDPPAFAKSHHHLQQGLKGYRTINQRAIESIASGGLLFTFSCSQAVSPADFQTMVFSCATNAKREVRIIERLQQPADHPISIHHPEGDYLKGLLLYVE